MVACDTAPAVNCGTPDGAVNFGDVGDIIGAFQGNACLDRLLRNLHVKNLRERLIEAAGGKVPESSHVQHLRERIA